MNESKKRELISEKRKDIQKDANSIIQINDTTFGLKNQGGGNGVLL